MAIELTSIIAVAREVAENYKLNKLPIDIERLCGELCIDVKYVDFSAIENQVGKKISGAIQKAGKEYTILVNEDEIDTRIRTLFPSC